MSVIINPRGTNGAGKTALVRRVMAMYGWGNGSGQPIHRAGRLRPICYRFRHPDGGRPLVVLGHYEATCGGCDTVHGMDEVFDLAQGYAGDGHDVLFEGLQVSREYQRSARLAQAGDLHVLRLGTPLDQCIQKAIARRRARRAIRPRISEIAAAEHGLIEEACRRLEPWARVETVSFEGALLRAKELLGLGRPSPS